MFSNFDSEKDLNIYQTKMKIEETLKDLKSLLGLEKIMNKKQKNLEKILSLLFLAHSIGFLMGEVILKKTYPKLRNNLQKSVYTGLFLLEIPIFG